MTAYRKFQELDIDTSLLGFDQRQDAFNYFCTPKGARIIGWAGTDGIHFCFIRDFGEMVFAVSPMNTQGDFVHPLANNFADFMRLLLACGDTAAIEQVYMWDGEQFNEFLKECPPTAEQQAVMSVIAEKL